MKTCLFVQGDSINYGVFGDLPSRGRRTHSGYLYSREDILPEAFVYQAGIERFECASQWDTIPNGAMWWARGPHDIFITRVKKSNLNFRNTPLEQRCNQSLHRNTPDPQLDLLTHNELLMWKGSDKCFIPFKSPNPQGYQGVWVHLSGRYLPQMGVTLDVVDRFNSDHILELVR